MPNKIQTWFISKRLKMIYSLIIDSSYCSIIDSALLTLLQSKCSYDFRYRHSFRDVVLTIYIVSDFTVFTFQICIQL